MSSEKWEFDPVTLKLRPVPAPPPPRPQSRGFSLLEMIMVTGLMLTMAAIGLPAASQAVASYRFKQGLNAMAAELTLAKLKAISQSNEYQVAASGTQNYQLNAASSAGFALAANTEALTLPTGVSFGYGAVTTAAGDTGEQTATVASPAQSTAITFNSLGLPVDSSGNPLAQNALYVTDGNQVGAVTVSLAGRVQRWYWMGTSWAMQ